jgi:hypothetical protein
MVKFIGNHDRSIVQRKNCTTDLVIKDHLVNNSSTTVLDLTRHLRKDETCTVGMKTQNSRNSLILSHCCMKEGEKRVNQREFENIVELLEPIYNYPKRYTELVQESVIVVEWHNPNLEHHLQW